MYKVIHKVKLDFDRMQEWRSPDDLPVLCFINVYEAAGLLPIVKKYNEENNEQICPIQQILCNFYTLQKLKNFIEHNWGTFDIEILGDTTVQWIPKSRKTQRRHPRKLKSAVRGSIYWDFINYSCGLDDEIEDDTLIFTDGKVLDEDEKTLDN